MMRMNKRLEYSVWRALWRARHTVLFVLVFAGAVLPRLIPTVRQALWADEIFSLAIATGHSLEHPAADARPELGDYVELPKPALPAVYQRYLAHDNPPAGGRRVLRSVHLSDTSPPLYYLLLNAWTRVLGTSDAALHLFSVIWSLACFPFLWWIGREVGGRRAALVAALLFAAAPVSVYYSTEGRMYSLLWFLTLGFLWLTLRLYRRGFHLPLYFAWIITAAAALLTHYFFSFVLLACLIALFIAPGRLQRGLVPLGAFMMGVWVLPWFIRVPESLARWRVTGTWLNGFPPWRQAVTAPAQLLWSFFSGSGYWAEPTWADHVALALFAIAAFPLWRRTLGRARFNAAPRRLLYGCLIAACLGPFVFDLLRNTSTLLIPRYALAGMPAAFLLAGYGLSRYPRRGRAALLALILIAWLPGTWTLLRSRARCGEPFRTLMAHIEEDLRVGDVILVHSVPSGVLGVARYMTTKVEVGSWVQELGRRRVPENLEALVAGRRRVILIRIHEVDAPVPEEDWLRENAVLTREEALASAIILYFVPSNGEYFSADSKGALSEGS